MRRILLSLAWSGWLGLCALGAYETTAKAPDWLGRHLPGRAACHRAEKATAWRPPTGVFVLDKLLHEGDEALRFYGLRPPS
ncbi:MAG: hypothetical protein R6X35_06880 [Candidatus Krumholzibacteriia bacterium]